MSKLIYDYVIVGGGIYGLRMGKLLAKKYNSAKILLVESMPQSRTISLSNNFFALESGANCKANSLIFEFITNGNKGLIDFCKERSLFVEKRGQIVAAKDTEDKRVMKLFMKSQEEVPCEPLSAIAANRYDESLDKNTKEIDFYSLPDTCIVDYNEIKSRLFSELREEQNVSIQFDTHVKNVKKESSNDKDKSKADSPFLIETESSKTENKSNQAAQIKAKFLINTAGVNGIKLAQLLGNYQYYQDFTYSEIYFDLHGEPSPNKIISSTPYMLHSGLKLVPIEVNKEKKTVFGPMIKFVPREEGFFRKLKTYTKFMKASVQLRRIDYDSSHDMKLLSLNKCIQYYESFYKGIQLPKDYRSIKVQIIEKNLMFSSMADRFETEPIIVNQDNCLHILNYTMRGSLSSFLPITDKAISMI